MLTLHSSETGLFKSGFNTTQLDVAYKSLHLFMLIQMHTFKLVRLQFSICVVSEETGDSYIVGSKIITLVGNAFAAVKSVLLFCTSLKYNSKDKASSLILKFPSLKCLASVTMSKWLWGVCRMCMGTGRGSITFPFPGHCPSSAIKVRRSHGRIRCRF